MACQAEHTSETFAVVDVADVPRKARLRAVESRCAERFPIYTGGGREDSVVDWVALRTPEVSAGGGSAWWRCDAFVAARPYSKTPAPHSGSVAGVMRPAVPVSLQRCVNRRMTRYLPCDRPHPVEQTARTIVLGRVGEPFLSRRLYVETVRPYCDRAFHRYSRRQSSKQSVETMFRWPTRKGWHDGLRSGSCWVVAEDGSLPPITKELRQ